MEFQIIWFILWTLLWVVYFSLDGFDLGCGILMNFISDNENEKKAVISSIGPFWDGNEVWLITAGGATFAAFPKAYAFMFSWFYIPLFLVLVTLILRGISIELRNKSDRKDIWDKLIFISSVMSSFLFGVFFSSLWRGVDIGNDGYTGGLAGILNINSIYGGIFFCFIFIFHGLLWLYYRIEGKMKIKIYRLIKKMWYLISVMFSVFILFLPQSSNPSFQLKGINWFLSVLFYFLSFVSLFALKKFINYGKDKISFIFSLLFVFFFFSGGFSSQYPYIIPSVSGNGVSIFDSSSSLYTLKLMTVVAFIFVPVVILYQMWVYRLLSDKIVPDNIKDSY